MGHAIERAWMAAGCLFILALLGVGLLLVADKAIHNPEGAVIFAGIAILAVGFCRGVLKYFEAVDKEADRHNQ